MIIGIGTDITEIERVEKACRKEGFLKKIFTDKELQLFKDRGQIGRFSQAGNFAAKEAVAKCLGVGFSGFPPTDVEILRELTGKPYVNLYGKALIHAEACGISKIHITISHCQSLAIAYAVAEKLDGGQSGLTKVEIM